MSTIFARAEGVMDLSPLSDEERALLFERMRNTVVVTIRVPTRKRRRGGAAGRGVGAGRGAVAGRGVGAGSAADGIDIATAEDDNRYGTGFVINSQGYVLTCASNIEGAGKSIVQVKYFGEEKPKPASIFFKDSKKNLIILRPKELPDRVYYTELAGVEGEDDNVHLGMQVYCIGHPTGLTYNLFIGQVCYPCDSKSSGQCRRIKEVKDHVDIELQGIKELDDELALVQLNNVHAGGLSANGSPVFDANGRVLGMLAFDSGHFDFAIHYKELRGIIADCNQKMSGLGMQLGELILEDVQPKAGLSKSAAPPLIDPVTLNVEEKLNVTLKRDGGVGNFEVQGTLSLQILNQEDGHIQVQIETGGNHGILFKTHPNMNKELFSNENILGLKDPNRPFPTGQAGDAGGDGLLEWRMQSQDESLVPLQINCWPSVSGNETYVNIKYEASSLFDLRNVVISVPLPALRETPVVKNIHGEWRYDARNSVLEWSILLIDNSNRSGSMEFVVPPAHSNAFFPISVRFSTTNTFSDLKVVNILPLKGGAPPKFAQRTQLLTENYQVV